MTPSQLFEYIIKPALRELGDKYCDTRAVILLLATAAQESHCFHWIHQIKGPALGGMMIQPNAHRLVVNWDRRQAQPALDSHNSPDERLIYDMYYAISIARILYYSWPIPLPDTTARDCYSIYKKCYNTKAGAATWLQFHANWLRYVRPVIKEMKRRGEL